MAQSTTIARSKIFYVILFILAWLAAPAQQLGLLGQYNDHGNLLNPAFIHQHLFFKNRDLAVGVAYRHQWASVDFAPRTPILHASLMPSSRNMVLGINLINDSTGPTSQTGAYLRYNYILSSDPDTWGIALGISAGLVQYRINLKDIVFVETSNMNVSENQQVLYPDFGLGAFYYQIMDWSSYGDDYIFAGVSVPQMLGLNLTYTDENGNFTTQRIQHYFSTFGLYKHLNEDMILEPSAWVKYAPNAPLHIDANVRLYLLSSFWVGMGGASSKAVHFEVGASLNEDMGFSLGDCRIGYAYNHLFNTAGPMLGATHEISLLYSFNF